MTDVGGIPGTVLIDLLSRWLPGRRWFLARAVGSELTIVDDLVLTDPVGEAEVHDLLLRSTVNGVSSMIQVPITLRGTVAGDAAEHSEAGEVIGVAVRADGSTVTVHEGVGDRAFLRGWLAESTLAPAAQLDLDLANARLIAGEQSNSSVILPGNGTASGAILKVFRGLWPGPNPDVDIPRVLAASGWLNVPRPLAWLECEWATDGVEQVGHLGVLSRFVPGAQDGFELACAMASRGESFETLAAELGAVVAAMHSRLAAAIPADGGIHQRVTTSHDIATNLRTRMEWATSQVPELTDVLPGVDALIGEIDELREVPRAQRVHGDLHLGQVLRAEDRWYVIDFEGEPLVPISERIRPDQPLRDVAGVLRSFDYAAARADADPDWAARSRLAMRDAYLTARGLTDPEESSHQTQTLLLRAFEVDKALYEVVYETQNRPSWATIPWNAVRRLVGVPASGHTE